MNRKQGFAAVAWLSKRKENQRGGNDRQSDDFDRSTTDSLALWRDAYL